MRQPSGGNYIEPLHRAALATLNCAAPEFISHELIRDQIALQPSVQDRAASPGLPQLGPSLGLGQ
eukprot:1735704-Alexandrium_andersonii.AAC.1